MNHPGVIVFLIQAAITVGVSVIGYVIFSPLHALSVIVGGSVAIIPQSLFGFWVFRQRGARNARAIAKNLFVGEGLKLSMTAALFALVWINSDPIRNSCSTCRVRDNGPGWTIESPPDFGWDTNTLIGNSNGASKPNTV